MNSDQFEGKWKELKGKAQEKWGELTNDEVDQIDGNREQLEGVLQQKYGKAKEDIKKEVDEWLNS